MAAAAYPCVTGTDHRTLGPAAGHLRNRPVSLEMPFRSGPRNCVQSDPCAAGSREATPAAPTPMIQPRRVYIQDFSSCVEKNNTFARSITRYSGLKIPGKRRKLDASWPYTRAGWRRAHWRCTTPQTGRARRLANFALLDLEKPEREGKSRLRHV